MKKKSLITLMPSSGIYKPLEDRYINIPIALLQGIFHDQKTAFQNIAIFCLYQHATVRLHMGTQVERIIISGNFLGLSVDKWNAERLLYHGRQLYYNWCPSNSTSTSTSTSTSPSPRGGIKLKHFSNFFNNEKTEFELIVFCAFIALRSIIQKDPYKKSTFETLFARMAGYSSASSVHKKLPEVIQKYQSRHFRSKIINELEDHWHLAYEADHIRGFYFSFIMNHEELCTSIQHKKNSKKTKASIKVQSKKGNREKAKQIQ